MRFCRLMAKTCLANEVGPDGCWMLAVIAHTEDAGGYRKPVTFWNEQLFPLVGIGSVSALKRLRARLVDAGWLNYTPGRKRRAASYFVVIPERLADLDDGPTCEMPGEYAGPEMTQKGMNTSPRLDQKADGKRSRKRTESGPPSSLTQDNLPQEKTAAAPPSDTAPTGHGSDSADGKPRERDPLFDAIAEVTASDPRMHGSRIGRVKKALLLADPPYTAADVYRLRDIAPRALNWSAGRHLTLNEVEQYIPRVRAQSPPVAGRPNGRPANRDEYIMGQITEACADD